MSGALTRKYAVWYSEFEVIHIKISRPSYPCILAKNWKQLYNGDSGCKKQNKSGMGTSVTPLIKPITIDVWMDFLTKSSIKNVVLIIF